MRGECGARGWICTLLPGGFWASVIRHYDRGGRCSLGWDRRRRVTPVQTASQEAIICHLTIYLSHGNILLR